MFRFAGRRALNQQTPSYTVFRRWNTSSTPSFIPKEALEKVSRAIKEESKYTPPADQPSSPIGAIFTGIFAGLLLFTGYSISSPIQPTEPKFIMETAYPAKLVKRAKYRLMSFYKSFVDPTSEFLLPDAFGSTSPYYRPYTLVLELDKALVYSKWDPEKGWTVAKRPYADYFLAYLSQFYEIVVFTNNTAMYGHPVIDKLDTYQGVMYRLYRDSTVYDLESGEQVKDLRLLNRDLKRVVLFDPEKKHFATTQPENAVEMKPWEGDSKDTYLLDMIPFLESLAMSQMEDVRDVLVHYAGKDIPKVYAQNLSLVQQMQREEQDKSQSAASVSSTSSWIGSLLSMLGMSGKATKPVPPSQKEYAEMQAQHYVNVMTEMQSHKKLVEEETKKRQEEHENMMKKLSDVRVTLWDLFTLGPDQAILSRADPEVKQYLEQNRVPQ